MSFPSPFRSDAEAIVFTGTMDYWPNASAVLWFAEAVMPTLRHLRPQAEFHIVGANPGREVRQLANREGICVTGRVADTRPYIAHASAVVAPLKIARGIQNKVLEAMAMAKPVIASPQAFEGVRAQPGRDLLVADGGSATIHALQAVLEGRHPRLGSSARQAVEASYGWPTELLQLEALLQGRSRRARVAAARTRELPV
jgi:glycosyltransferase involved in cell wall biosynthesis